MDKVKISLTGVPVQNKIEFEQKNGGYGKVNWYVAESLKKLGYQLSIDDSTADVNFCCANPSWLQRRKNQYNIGYTTHESTQIIPDWQSGLDSMDEIWTMSHWIASSLSHYTDKVTTIVHPGVGSNFNPIPRTTEDKFYFLHTGEPADRKMGLLVFQAFVEEFGDNPDVVLVFKTQGPHRIVGANGFDNIIFIGNDFTEEQYAGLLSKMHCLVYPTLGEGGGMMPLEALATGMPVISTWEWADYKDFIHLKLDSVLTDIPEAIQQRTPLRGNGFLTTVESIREQMVKVYENYEFYQNLYYNQSILIGSRYGWDKIVSDNAVPRLKELETLL